MPVVSCPKCPTKLRVPDGASGNTKCPKCGTVFPVGATAAPAFEVVDDDTPATPTRPAARPAAKPAPPPPPPPAKGAFDDLGDDVEVYDESGRVLKKAKRRRDDDDEDDDDRPRRRRRDDDDDEDRPRSRRRRDDDDDDDDRPRRRKGGRRRGGYDDDDDEDDNWRPAGKSSGFANAKTGVLLLNISFWIYMSVLALITFFLFLAWVGAFDGSSSRAPRGGFDDDGGGSGETLVMLVGITGLANWVLAIIGLGFCIAGPARARGMAITAIALAGAHLLFTGLTVNNLGGGFFGRFSGGLGGGTWFCWTSMLPLLDVFLPVLIYAPKGAPLGDFVLAFLAGACELARLIFILLTVKQLSIAAKDYETAGRAQIGVVAGSVIVGASALLALLVVVLLDAGVTKSPKAIGNIMMVTILLIYSGFTFMTLLPALSTNDARNSLARKARRG